MKKLIMLTVAVLFGFTLMLGAAPGGNGMSDEREKIISELLETLEVPV